MAQIRVPRTQSSEERTQPWKKRWPRYQSTVRTTALGVLSGRARRRRRRDTALRLVERFVHQHHRNVADDGGDAVAFHALQPLLDDPLLASEFLPELVADRGPLWLADRDPPYPPHCEG